MVEEIKSITEQIQEEIDNTKPSGDQTTIAVENGIIKGLKKAQMLIARYGFDFLVTSPDDITILQKTKKVCSISLPEKSCNWSLLDKA